MTCQPILRSHAFGQSFDPKGVSNSGMLPILALNVRIREKLQLQWGSSCVLFPIPRKENARGWVIEG